MKNLIKLTFAFILAAILFTSCSSEDNPIAATDPGNGGGDPDPIVIKTPRYMRVESISVRHFPKNKPNGDTWDWNPLSSAERKPDLEVVLQRSGNYLPAYWSDQRKNATYTSTYVFTEPASPEDGELPHAVPYTQTWKVSLIDRDGFANDNDKMGSVTFKPSSVYKDDNATNFDKTITSGDIKVRLRGAWIY
jgi:hypothetical protein